MIETHFFADGTEVLRCTDCHRWIHVSSDKEIVHSSRCDHREAQPERQAKRQRNPDSPASGLSADEAYEEWQAGRLTGSDALNTDY